MVAVVVVVAVARWCSASSVCVKYTAMNAAFTPLVLSVFCVRLSDLRVAGAGASETLSSTRRRRQHCIAQWHCSTQELALAAITQEVFE